MEPIHPPEWSENLRGFDDIASPGSVVAYNPLVALEEASRVRDEFEGRRKLNRSIGVDALGG
jgi:hypothetical protein